MKVEKMTLKNTQTIMLKSIMSGESYDDLLDAKEVLGKVYLNKYEKDKNLKEYTAAMETLKDISYNAVVHKVADKNQEPLLELNPDGTSTGRYIQRGVAHNKQNLKWHREVFALVLREDGCFPVIKRSLNKGSHAGEIGGVCGHAVGKTAELEAVAIECAEELKTLFPQESFIRLTEGKMNEREDNLAYTHPFIVASNLKEGVFMYQESEVDGIEWINVDQLELYVNASKHEDTKGLTIFRDTDFYRSVIASLRKLFTLDHWHDYLTNGDYETIHKHLGLKTPKEEMDYYEERKKRGTFLVEELNAGE